MTFGFPAEPYEVDPRGRQGPRLLLILHADHEQNCSTSTVRDGRLVGREDCSRRVSAGINALWGPLHGGRQPGRARDARRHHRERGGDVKEFVRKVKNKEDGVKLMGFGHRVYRNYDPRAALVKQTRTRCSASSAATTR